MYKKQLRTSIIIGVVEIITFLAIIAIHHFDTAKALFPLLWLLLAVFVLELGVSFVFGETDKRWRRRWKTPLWQAVLWAAFFAGGVAVIFRYPEFWDSYGTCFILIFLMGSNFCRNISRYLIVKRYDFDRYESAAELISECPEAGKYIK